MRRPGTGDGRAKLLDAALALLRAKGYAATSVEDLCRAAGVTKGAFFHHFASKEDLGVAAVRRWSETTGQMFASASYHARKDPLDRVLGYLDYRRELLAGEVSGFTCLAGTIVQETYGSSLAIRAACDAAIGDHAQTLEVDFAEALHKYSVRGVTAKGLALHTQAVLQGAFILAKAKGGASIAADSIAHVKRYLELLFNMREKHHARDH